MSVLVVRIGPVAVVVVAHTGPQARHHDSSEAVVFCSPGLLRRADGVVQLDVQERLE